MNGTRNRLYFSTKPIPGLRYKYRCGQCFKAFDVLMSLRCHIARNCETKRRHRLQLPSQSKPDHKVNSQAKLEYKSPAQPKLEYNVPRQPNIEYSTMGFMPNYEDF